MFGQIYLFMNQILTFCTFQIFSKGLRKSSILVEVPKNVLYGIRKMLNVLPERSELCFFFIMYILITPCNVVHCAE